jgi:hypothetical protein
MSVTGKVVLKTRATSLSKPSSLTPRESKGSGLLRTELYALIPCPMPKVLSLCLSPKSYG